jgi:hypothetical protein
MVETFDRLARNASAVRQAIAAELPEVMRQARQQMDAAAAVLLGQPGRPAGREGGRRDSSADGASPGASGGPTA